ncbi:MAG: CHASE4 domain-containing protein, partial [Ignavibacteria bacterium]
MFKSVQFKIIFIITLFTLMFIAYNLIEKSGQNLEVQSLFKLREKEKNELFDRLVKLQGSSLEIFAYDYTFWDEMVNFVSSKDTTWAYKEVSSGLPNYKVNFVWIYDAYDSLIYSFNTLYKPGYKRSPFGKDELRKIFGNEYFSHFFMKMDTCLIELRVAPIQPSMDLERKSKPRGRFVAARLWNQSLLKDLNNLTEANVSLIPPNMKKPDVKSDDDDIVIKRDLCNSDGSPLITLYAVFDNDILIGTLLNLYNEKYIAVMIFSIVSILILLGLLVNWVSRPIKKLSDGLKFRDVKYIESLKGRDNEFGRLANTIIGLFKHEEALKKEIIEHEITLESLMKSEASVTESREYYKHLFENAHDAIMIIEPENEKIVDVNERACKIYGYSEEEFKVIDLSRLTSGSRNGKELIENTLKYEHLSGYETTHVNKNLEPMNMEINSSVINVKDRKLILTVSR